MNGVEPAECRHLLVCLPNWVGDVVMATPVLAALRRHFAGSRITYLMRDYVAEVVRGGGWHDDEVFWPPGRGWRREARLVRLSRELRRREVDLAILLTNSFRSALALWAGGARRRVGYARDGRGPLLTDRLRPLRRGRRFVPSPVLDYYIRLAEHVGCAVPDRRLRLGISAAQRRAGEELLAHYGLSERRFAVINPGAAFGAAKCWLPERFAEVCDLLIEQQRLVPVIVGAPNEYPLMRRIAELARRDPVCMCEPGTTLGSLKVVMQAASLLVCNDTGPRHYGIAFDVPTVTIFGPTHQEWTDTGYEREIKLQADVDCGPCQLPRCPLDLRCMERVTVEMVMDAVARLL